MARWRATPDSYKCNASVRAVDYCDLYTLDKDAFDQVLARHPAFAAHIQQEAEKRHPNPTTA